MDQKKSLRFQLKVFFIPLLLIGLLFCTDKSSAAILLSEDWESGTPPSSWPYKQAPSACDAAWQGNTYNGWNPEVADYCTSFPSWNQIGRTSAKAHSGTYSFFHRRAAGTVESGDIGHDLPTPYKSKIYIQFWVWFDSNFAGINTPTTIAPEGLHFLFTNTAQSGTGLRVNLYTRVPYTSPSTCGPEIGGMPNAPFMFFSIQNNTNDFSTGTYSNGDNETNCYNLLNHTNQWIKVQFMFDAANDVSTIWIDDVQRYTANSTISQSNFDWIMFSNYGPSDMDGGASYTQSYYIDDITVSDQFIAGGGSTPTPTVSLSANPTSITSGASSTLTWSSTNATSCTASGSWSGTKATSGTQSVSPTASSTYTLICTGTGGSGNASATVTVTTPDTTPPTSPTNLAANATSTSSITVTWTPATDNVGVTGYQAERCTGLSCSNFTQVGTPTASPFVNSGLTMGTGYSYHVRAMDAAGNLSGWSNVIGATTQSTTLVSCNTVTTSNFSQSAYNSYGAPFDAFQTSTNLLDAKCTSSDTHTVNLTTGITGDTTRIVYTKGYYYDPVTAGWTQYSGTCNGALNGEWCQGSISATITSPNLSTASAANPAYVVGMTCSVQGGGWKCGCRDTTCSNFYWQVQGAGQ